MGDHLSFMTNGVVCEERLQCSANSKQVVTCVLYMPWSVCVWGGGDRLECQSSMIMLT